MEVEKWMGKKDQGKIWTLKYFGISTGKKNMSWWTKENVKKKKNPVHKEKYYWWVKPREWRERGKEERGSKVSRILIDNIRARMGGCASKRAYMFGVRREK
jgi:hypothetical protein